MIIKRIKLLAYTCQTSTILLIVIILPSILGKFLINWSFKAKDNLTKF